MEFEGHLGAADPEDYFRARWLVPPDGGAQAVLKPSGQILGISSSNPFSQKTFAASLELAINLKTAKTLGRRIPQSILQRADQAIE